MSEEAEEAHGGSPAKQQALRERKRRETMEKLVARLDDEDANVRFEVALAIKKLATKADTPMLVKALRAQTDIEHQIAIVDALGAVRDESTLETLRFVGEHGAPPVKLAVIDALARIGSDLAIPLLTGVLLESDNIELRKRAASALAMIGGSQALANLEQAYATLPDGGPRRATKWALATLQGKIPQTQSDTDMSEGRRLALLHQGTLFYFYRPTERKGSDTQPWLLVCIHGSGLNAEQLFDLCQPLARQYRVALLVPLFDNLRFPEFWNLNVRGERADLRLLELFDHVSQHAKVKSREVYLFGAEMGGEFVQRFTLAHPTRIARAAFATTRYLQMDFNLYYPIGLRESPLAPDLKFNLLPVVKTDFALLLTNAQENTQPFKQFYNSFGSYAELNGLTSRIRLRFLPDSGDNLPQTWEVAHQYLFPSS